MEILEVNKLSKENTEDILRLMFELDPSVKVTPQMLSLAASEPSTHFFAAVEDGRVHGCASLCITRHPLGLKGTIEDVVVSSSCRGKGIGKQLVEHIIEYAKGLAPIELFLTSRPAREKANLLYQMVGFQRYETNVYKLKI